MSETFEAFLNNEWVTVRKFKPSERVKNKHGDIGTVIDTEDGGLFVNVDWSSRKGSIGKTWLAVSLEAVEN